MSIREAGRSRATLLSGTGVCHLYLYKFPWLTVEVAGLPSLWALRTKLLWFQVKMGSGEAAGHDGAALH